MLRGNGHKSLPVHIVQYSFEPERLHELSGDMKTVRRAAAVTRNIEHAALLIHFGKYSESLPDLITA